MKLKNILQKVNAVFRKVEEYVLAAIMAVMAILLIYGVFARFVLNSSLQFQEEFGSLLLICSCYIGSIAAVRRSKHIRMVFLSDNLPYKATYALNLFNCLLAAAAFAFFGTLCAQYMLMNIANGRSFMTFQLPRWIVWIPVVVGLYGTALQYLLIVFYNIVDHRQMEGKEQIWIGSERRFGEPE